MLIQFPEKAIGKSGELLSNNLAGNFYSANRNGNVFTASSVTLTIPAIAATLVSVFSLYNPRNSGVVAELIDTEIGSVLAATVVNTYSWYFSADKNADTATFTTKGTAQGGMIDGGPAGNKVQFYTALTHVGTPVLWRMIGSNWATTSTQANNMVRKFDGSAIVMPGTVISIAGSTAAGTTNGNSLAVTWVERPVV